MTWINQILKNFLHLRPIISTLSCPTYELSSFIATLLEQLILNSKLLIKYSFTLVNKVKALQDHLA